MDALIRFLKGILHLLRKIVHLGGWRRLYAGLPPTLLRDAPFSAIYWSSYEAIKRSHFLRVSVPFSCPGGHANCFLDVLAQNQNTFMTAFISGAASGTFAAILTNPIDVIKTRRQMLIHANLQSVLLEFIRTT
jgi:solute carrier family 25 protein 39/40